VGLIVQGPPARDGAKLTNPATGEEVGVVTSGSFSPHLKKPISMGYVTKGSHKTGTELQVEDLCPTATSSRSKGGHISNNS